jgi:hypothetical protein
MDANENKAFTLDGVPVDIAEFVADNAETFEAEDREAIEALRVGEEIVYGGGAAAEFVLKRNR